MGEHSLSNTIDELSHLLPAQGPISIFIHHNTLHAFEHLPFEDAVEAAARRFGTEPYLSESRYRDKFASGRILARDIEVLLREQLGIRGDVEIPGLGRRLDVWLGVVQHGIPEASGQELIWAIEETRALAGLRSLWDACLAAVDRTPAAPPVEPSRPVRHRDLIVAAGGSDVDAWFHPPLIRFLAGHLDQGISHWPMPERNLGIHGSFIEIYNSRLAAQCGPWARSLPRIVEDDRTAGRDALTSIANSLAELGVLHGDADEYLGAELLALRGWAGIIRQIEERPDRVPARDLDVTLRGYLAVRLLFERAALEEAGRELAFAGPMPEFRAYLRERSERAAAPTREERAWPLFHVARLCGVEASRLVQWPAANVAAIEGELRELDVLRRRRILHQAFERAIRYRFYDALIEHRGHAPAGPPPFQAVFCIDEREESFRRHLEEVDPSCETLGTAGFFNVAIYHQGATDAHPRPLCPVAIRPEHYVPELESDAGRLTSRSRRLQRRAAGFLGYNVHLGSRLPIRGALLMTAFGWLALIPLVLRVLFPWLFSRWRRVRESSAITARTRLDLEQGGESPVKGTRSGFSIREMADIVRRVLEEIGAADRLSPLVLIVGHGSISLNNPHESAHDCGACGGGRGGPNARAFAQMANDVRVRGLLAQEGLAIGDSTWFVGAQRNTCNNDVTFFDTDLIPERCQEAFGRARAAFEEARRREAHERCRRFDAVPAWYPPLAALAHVEGRAADLAQPRPEYGHATNAFCVVGRRARTRGLFLDRRTFLVSYDPTRDGDDAVLARILNAVVPVVAGISLEYYFSYVDPLGYGCGTKLPHNVTSLLGVMDGAQSDLRTGLPWQMVEIHEPARLTIVVECAPDRLERVLRAHPAVDRLVRNRWIWLACLDPDADRLWEMRADGFVAHRATERLSIIKGDSAAWYQGKRGFLGPVSLVS
jgi:uncharacterized protein YbcC (UPF0753/DUF2309 family)